MLRLVDDFAIPHCSENLLVGERGFEPPIPWSRNKGNQKAGQGNNAVAEFQEILDHRGIVVSDPIGALAHLQLAKAHAMS